MSPLHIANPDGKKGGDGAVAAVYVYGPRGAHRATAMLTRAEAEQAIHELRVQLVRAARVAEDTELRTSDCTACRARTGEPVCSACDRFARRRRVVPQWEDRS